MSRKRAKDGSGIDVYSAGVDLDLLDATHRFQVDRFIEEPDLHAYLRFKQGPHSEAHFARRIGVSAMYLNQVMRGIKPASDRILKAVGLRRDVRYIRV